MNQHILYREEARATLVKGIKTAARIASVTLGPTSYNVILYKKRRELEVLNNGFAITKEIELDNFFENTGIKLIKQASSKTNEVVGDGTTATIVIAHSLIYYGMAYIVSGIGTVGITTGIQKAVEFLSNKLVEHAQPVKSIHTIQQIATMASGNNKDVGTIITAIIDRIGPEGMISLENSNLVNTTFEISQGIKIDKGFFSSGFVKKEDLLQVTQNLPYILITDKKITLVKELIPILELVSSSNRPLLILAEDLSPEVLSTLIVNRIKNIVDVIAIKLPGFGNQRQLLLEDISIATNSKIISEKIGLRLDSIKLSMLGSAEKVVIDKDSTTILLDNKQRHIHKRCNELRKQINTSNTIYEEEGLKNRLAKISSRTAVIRIGSSDVSELHEKKKCFEKALNSVRAAVKEGVVPGGWSISVHLSLELLVWAQKHLCQDELKGALIVRQSFLTPLRQIIRNTGHNEAIIISQLEQHNFNIGYDTTAREYVNMYTVGIIDSAKVIRLALHNAASIAKMFLTTECVIVNR